METINCKFVTSIPDKLDDHTLYISMEYATAIHKCICGCGNEVVTPFSPTDWELNYDGESVSLNPSIGNWSFECQSHYWIVKNKIVHASKWSKDEIEYNRKVDKKVKADFYSNNKLQKKKNEEEILIQSEMPKSTSSWEKFKKFLVHLFWCFY